MTHPKFDEVWQVSAYQELNRMAARSQPATEARKAEVMKGWAVEPDLKPATPWLSLSVALAILEGRHPALAATEPDR